MTRKTVLMARQRNILQIILSFALTEAIYHLAYIVILFIASVTISPYTSPDPDVNRKWLKVISNIEVAINLEVCIFAGFHFLRQAYDACRAVRIEQTWYRAEEPRGLRILGFLLQLLNLVISATFICFPLYCRNCIPKVRSEDCVRQLNSG